MLQAADVSPRLWRSPVCSVLCRSTNVRISFCCNCHRFTIRMQKAMYFSFLNFWRSKCQLRQKKALKSRLSFQYHLPIWLQSSWHGCIVYHPGNQWWASFVVETQQKARPGGRDCKAASCHWERWSPRSERLPRKAKSSRRAYCSWWKWRSAELNKAFLWNKASVADLEKLKAFEEVRAFE